MNQFNLTHYVPILRWKQAEQFALAKLYEDDSRCVTPLIELVPENFVRKTPKGQTTNLNVEDVINKIGSQVFRYWGQRQFYIDPGLLPADVLLQGRSHFLIMLSQYASTLRLSLIPVIRIGMAETYNSAVRDAIHTHNQGACLRLNEEDIRRPTLRNDIDALLTFLQTSPEYVDLMVDFQNTQLNVPTFDDLCQLLPSINKWRNYMVAGGAFPENLSGLKKNDIHRLPRAEWALWKKQTMVRGPAGRLPIYSDYTIQYPHYRARKGPMNISASIRYTSNDDWVIMRGESISAEDGPGTAQWPANAELLCGQKEYCGDTFSYGDSYIKEKIAAYDNPGSAMTWLRAGINHHMTFVVRQLGTLFGASTAVLS